MASSRKPAAKTPNKGKRGGNPPAPAAAARKTAAPKKAAPLKKAPAKKAAAPKRPPGRPTMHTPAIVEAICAALMEGQSLRCICAKPEMPGMSTVMRWLHDDEGGFREQYARAREVQAEVYAEDTVEISDREHRTITIEWEDKGGRKKAIPVMVAMDPADVAHRKLQVQARQWYAGKLAPKRYGVTAGVGDGEDGLALVLVRDLTGRKEQAPPQEGGGA
jgi:hypothetical protein